MEASVRRGQYSFEKCDGLDCVLRRPKYERIDGFCSGVRHREQDVEANMEVFLYSECQDLAFGILSRESAGRTGDSGRVGSERLGASEDTLILKKETFEVVQEDHCSLKIVRSNKEHGSSCRGAVSMLNHRVKSIRNDSL